MIWDILQMFQAMSTGLTNNDWEPKEDWHPPGSVPGARQDESLHS